MHMSICSFCLFSAAMAFQPSVWAVEGDRDPSFNTGQVLSVYVPFNAATDSIPALIGLSTLSNGAFLAAVRYGAYPSYTVELIKILKDGTLAQNFGINGIRDLANPEIDWGAMTTLPGPDTVILAGSTVMPGSSNSVYNFHVVRLDSGGNVDNTFNANTGYNNTSPGVIRSGAHDYVHAVHVLPSTGQILIAGNETESDLSSGMGLVRLNGNGTADTSFGNGGTATMAFPTSGGSRGSAYAITVDSNFRILLSGYATAGTGASAHSDFAAVRFTNTGHVDTCTNAQNLSVNCSYTYAFHIGGKFNDEASDIRVDQNGKIYLVGSSSYGTTSTGSDGQKNSILRLTDQFQPDTTYNPTLGHESFFMQAGVTDETNLLPSALIDAKNRLMVSSGYAFVGIARFVSAGGYDSSYNNGTALTGRVAAITYGDGVTSPEGQPRMLLDGDRPVVAEISGNSNSAFNLRVTRLLGDKIFSSGFQ